MAVAVSSQPTAPHTLSVEHMSTAELASLSTSLSTKLANSAGKGSKDALALLGAGKGPTIAELLYEPVKFVAPKSVHKEDEIPYKPVNARPTPAAAPSTNGSSVASTSKLPAAAASASSSSASASSASVKRAFPLIGTASTWGKPLPVGAGLQNLGNTCFLNSALQCLLHTAPFVRWLETHPLPCDVQKKKSFCMTCSMKQCARGAFTSGKRSYAPKPVVNNLRHIAKHFRVGRQEDAHEFLRFAIDAMQASELFGKGKLAPALQHQSPLHQLFGGRLRSRVHCMSCGHNSDTFDNMLDLSLDLNGAKSLKDALGNLVKVDRLSGGNKYKCEKCKKLVNAEKSFTIEEAPLVLTIHLKRFTPLGKKIGGLVKYPEVLKLGDFMSDPSLNPSYRLSSLLLHSGGGPHSGHYTAFVRAPTPNGEGKWHDMNDDYVSPTPPPMSERNAYVLFYVRERGEALKAALAGAAKGGITAGGGGGVGKKRARESTAGVNGGGGSAAGTPIKRARSSPERQNQEQASSPAMTSVQIPFALPSASPGYAGARPPEILTASKTASPRLTSHSQLGSPDRPTQPTPNPFLPPPHPSQPQSHQATTGGLLGTPVPAKQFVSRISDPQNSVAGRKLAKHNSTSGGGGPKQSIVGGMKSKSLSRKEKKEMKKERMGRMGIKVPPQGKGQGKNRPGMLRD
ncbi:hypothetical protein JCM11641_007603 [Rhodosporidiobolus odoratus]